MGLDEHSLVVYNVKINLYVMTNNHLYSFSKQTFNMVYWKTFKPAFV